MLTPEAAEELLKKHASPKYHEERKARLAGLAAPLRDTARTLFQLEEEKEIEDEDEQEG